MINQLRQQGVNDILLQKVEEYINKYKSEDDYSYRIPKDKITYLGKDIWEQAITAVLQGQNLLLVGPKSTGKNLLANNLASLFQRPSFNVSLNINTDENQLIGSDTFIDNKVVFRDGPISIASKIGGFVVLDEINMAKNEALSILHSTLDDRRIIDIPGYDLIDISPSTRFIATMNYGYLGTRELNEALVSRFMILELPSISDEYLSMLIKANYPDINEGYLARFVKLFRDIETKVSHSEISSKSLDLRGLISAIGSIKIGLNPVKALEMGLVNKTFDEFERKLVKDMVLSNFSSEDKGDRVFNGQEA